MVLSKRLSAVASMVTAGNRVADVGCDHGYVPIWLVERQISPSAIAADVRKGPLQRAACHIEEHGLQGKIETRLSDGLEHIEAGEAQTLIMTGIGGLLMIRILEAHKTVAKGFQELILSPQSDLLAVRKYLLESGFTIKYEKVVEEDGKFYFIFYTVPGRDMSSWSFSQLCYGKTVLRESRPQLEAFLQQEYRSQSALLAWMDPGLSANRELPERIGKRVEELKGRLDCIRNKFQEMEAYIDEVQ